MPDVFNYTPTNSGNTTFGYQVCSINGCSQTAYVTVQGGYIWDLNVDGGIDFVSWSSTSITVSFEQTSGPVLGAESNEVWRCKDNCTAPGVSGGDWARICTVSARSSPGTSTCTDSGSDLTPPGLTPNTTYGYKVIYVPYPEGYVSSTVYKTTLPSDTTPPNVSISASPSGWTNGNVTISGSITDNVSVQDYRYKCTYGASFSGWTSGLSFSFTCSATGGQTAYVQARDTSSNVGDNEVNYYIDTAAPTTTITSPAAGSWHNAAFSVSFTDSDTGGSNLASCYYRAGGAPGWTSRSCNGSVSISVGSGQPCSTQGLNSCTVEAYAKDNAGNSNISTPASRQFSIDYTAPSPGSGLTCSPAFAGTFPINITWTPGTDSGGSGISTQYLDRYGPSGSGYPVIDWQYYNGTTNSAQINSSTTYFGYNGGYSWVLTTRDNAGNASSTYVTSNTCVWDTVAPRVEVFASSGNLDGGVYYTNAKPTIGWSVTESGGSGIQEFELWRECSAGSGTWCRQYDGLYAGASSQRDDTVTADGCYKYGLHAIDNAGNCIAESGGHCGGVTSDSLDTRPSRTITVCYDTTPPDVTWRVDPGNTGQGILPKTLAQGTTGTTSSNNPTIYIYNFSDATSDIATNLAPPDNVTYKNRDLQCSSTNYQCTSAFGFTLTGSQFSLTKAWEQNQDNNGVVSVPLDFIKDKAGNAVSGSIDVTINNLPPVILP